MHWRILLSALKSGDDRIILPTPAFVTIATIIGLLQWNIATASTLRLSLPAKQIVSLPIMLACLAMPVMFAGKNSALTIVEQLYLFSTVLCCIEPIYVAPALYGANGCLSTSDLNKQLWSCLKKAPVKRSPSLDKKKTVHSRLYIFVPMVTSMLLTDVAASWLNTFSGEDVFVIQKEKKGLFFLFFAMAVVVLTFAINAFGYILQCIYLFAYGVEEYDSDEWRPLMDNPILSSSLDNLWSHRWHQVFRAIWVAIPFKPVCMTVTRMAAKESGNDSEKKRTPPMAIIAASLSVFFVSGLMHEYLALCGAGWDAYATRYMGQECAFFVVHGLGILVEKIVGHYVQVQKTDSWLWKVLPHVWVITFSFITFPLFMNSFAYFELWHANPFTVFTPFITDSLWSKYPVLRPFCGSLI